MEDIITITLAAIICGAESWYDVADFGKRKQSWLSTFLELPSGIPSHDTFNRFYSLADSAALEECFGQWVTSIANVCADRVINIDGKCLRGSRKEEGGSFIHMVSAWCNSSNIVLGQHKVYDKSNEITAIPPLLEVLFIEGATVTIDAMGCQKNIIMVLSKRIDKKSGKEEQSERYYISSKKATAQQFNEDIRSHWGIENKLHWCLDVAFREDMSKKRAGESAQNFSLMTKSALNLLKNHNLNAKDSGGTKISLKRKKNMAAWDNDYLMDILGAAL